jgi:hypothetical protein
MLRILGGALLLAAIGCTHRLVPSTYPVHPDKIPALTAGGPLEVVNGVTEIREVFLASRMGHEYLGDLMAWTSTAVQLLSGELQNRGFSVDHRAPRTLTLEVSDAKLLFGFATIRCIVVLDVTSSDGKSWSVEGSNASPGTIYRACDGAITRAIEAFLSVPGVKEYLAAADS